LYLDKLQVEKERGITVRAHTTSLVYKHSDGESYLLNLIDTPVTLHLPQLSFSAID
jgi:GTP-binding protein LepA